MIESFAAFLFNSSVKNNVLRQEDEELYLFAFRVAISYVSTLLALVLVGILTNSFLPTVFFLFFFIPLRIFAGGAHNSSYTVCFWVSVFIYLVIALAGKWVVAVCPLALVLAVYFAGVVLIFLLAPVPDPNKPLEPEERALYKKKARCIAAVESAVIIAMVLGHVQTVYLYYSMFASISVAVFAVVGYAKNMISR